MSDEIFKTTDMFLVAYLLYKNFPPCKSPIAKKRYVTFFFEKTAELEKAVLEFRTHTATCDPLTLLEKFRTVKSLALDARNEYEMLEQEEGVTKNE